MLENQYPFMVYLGQNGVFAHLHGTTLLHFTARVKLGEIDVMFGYLGN